jgi:hypothetical protein
MQTIDQIPVSNEQINQISSLSDYAEKLQGSISTLSNELNSGKLRWNEIAKKGTATFEQLSNEGGDNSFTEISKNFQDYPGLIYDGPFSEHITDIKPVGITGEKIDSNKAIEIGKKFVEKNVNGKTVELEIVLESIDENVVLGEVQELAYRATGHLSDKKVSPLFSIFVYSNNDKLLTSKIGSTYKAKGTVEFSKISTYWFYKINEQ